MFVRSIKVRSSSGDVHEYVRIVASVREDGRVKQKVVANLGRRDTLEAVLPLLNRFLQGEDDRQQLVQLQRWYRTLDYLLLNKDAIEIALYQRLRDLFHFQPELVFYDLTSTYFEGHGPALAKHGYSRDGQPRKVQVVMGVVMVAGRRRR